MKNLTVGDILKVTNGKLIIGNEKLECGNFSRDTRSIQKGDTYIAIKGEKFDGNIFWKEAFKNGADSVIVQDIEFSNEELKEFENKTIIKVEDTMQALYKIASYKREINNIPVVAITGSVGKTSTKDMVASVVSQKYKTLKTIGNNNNNIGLPFTILRLKDEEIMILEMGMNHFGEIHLLSNIAKPDICVITNIGTSHIGNLGSKENILKAKLEILDGADNPTIIINNDDKLLHKWYLENKDDRKIITYGIENESDIMAKNMILKQDKSTYKCDINGKEINVEVPIAGRHFVLNSLCATTVGITLNIDINKIINGIKNVELTKKRMDIKEINGIKVINDAYNASPEAMKASLNYLASFKDNRKIAVLGDMFELGKYSKKLHKLVGEYVCENNIEILVCAGENAKLIADEALKKGMKKEKVFYLEEKDKILELLRKITKSGDVVLFKASNGMKFYELADNFLEMIK